MSPRAFSMPAGHFTIAGAGNPYKRRHRDKRGNLCESRDYAVEIINEHGARRKVNLHTADKSAAHDIIARMRETAHLRGLGIEDQYEESRKTPLSEHLADYGDYLRSQHCTAGHIRESLRKIERTFEMARINRWPRIDADLIAKTLDRLTDARPQAKGLPPEPVSLQTRNHYLKSLKAFLTWMVDVADRMPKHPLRGLKRKTVRADDRQRIRRALTVEEMRKLIAAAHSGPAVKGMAGPRRALLYQVIGGSALRAGEARSLTWECFELEGAEPCIVLNPADTKNRQGGTLKLVQPELAERLRKWREHHPDEEQPFPMPRRQADMLKVDLEAAGIPYIDEYGRYADFHALRHTAITFYYLWTHNKEMAQRFARHSSSAITDAIYMHLDYRHPNVKFDRMPDLSPQESEAEPLRATGTAGLESPPEKLTPNLTQLTSNLTKTHAGSGRHGAAHRTATGELRPPKADCGTPGRIRTCDPRLRRPVLYPLSHWRCVVGTAWRLWADPLSPLCGTPKGTRTPVTRLRTLHPGPLDDGGASCGWGSRTRTCNLLIQSQACYLLHHSPAKPPAIIPVGA